MLKQFLAVTIVLSGSNAIAASMEAKLNSATQKELKGSVTLEEAKEGLHVKAKVTGLKPNSSHGFHIHEKGECKGPGYKTAGGHFNPTHGHHGPAGKSDSHMGDLGNLVADKNGVATIDRVIANKDDSFIKSLKGKAILVHDKVDDLHSQPAGDSGDRIACGVIKTI